MLPETASINSSFAPISTSAVDAYVMDNTNATVVPEYRNTTELNRTDMVLSELYDTVQDAYIWIIIPVVCLGLLFNLVALSVLLCSEALRKATTGVYLMSLEISDSLFLVGELIRSLNVAKERYDSWGGTDVRESHLGITFMHTNDSVCKIAYFLRYSGQFASAWTVVVISIDRLVNISSLRSSMLHGRRRSLHVLLGIYLVSFGLCSYPFWTIGVISGKGSGYSVCTVTDGSSDHNASNANYIIWNRVVYLTGSLCLPWLLVFILTMLRVRQLFRAHRYRQKSHSSFRGVNSATEKAARKSVPLEFQCTAILLAVAFSFLIIRLPYTIAYNLYVFQERLWIPTHAWQRYRIYTAYKITNLLAVANYAISFFLYCLRSHPFRRELMKCLCGQRARRFNYDKSAQGEYQLTVRSREFPGEDQSIG